MKLNSLQEGFRPLKTDTGGKIRGEESPEIKKQRLRQATREFESYFILHMIKAMRQTIPESELIQGGLGKDMYTAMFDEELAKNMAGSSSGSLADMLYRSMEKHLETETTPAPDRDRVTDISDTPKPMRPVKPVPEPISQPVSESRHPNQAQTGRRIAVNPARGQYTDAIDRAARKYGLSPKLLHAVITVESGWRNDAVSPKGAKGLMQLTDSTAASMGVKDSFDPEQNIMGGANYLRQMLDRFDGNMRLALAAYNAGPGTVSQFNDVPPYPETRSYVEKVLARLHTLKKG